LNEKGKDGNKGLKKEVRRVGRSIYLGKGKTFPKEKVLEN